MNARFTRHATERITDRLNGIVTTSEISNAIARFPLKSGENYVDVKTLAKRIYLGDPSLPETPKGDKIVAKVIVDNRGATIITVMLRKSTSQSARYIN
jgi:hypothetical protein